MKKILELAAFTPFLMLAACASPSVITQVTAFADPTFNPAGKHVVVIGATKELDESLEFLTYKARLEERLKLKGMVIDPVKPDVVAVMAYAIDGGVTQQASMPLYGQTGGGTAHTYGNIYSQGSGTANYSSTTYAAPTYGVVGSQTYSYKVYTRNLWVNFYDIDRNKKSALYELKAKSEGSCDSIASIISQMLDASFSQLPMPSGKSETITTSWAGDC